LKYLYIDAIGGVSGDMLLGAFLDGLVPFEHLKSAVEKLGLPDYKIQIAEAQRHHIRAVKFSVRSGDRTARNLQDIIKLIEQSELASRVKKNAISVFQKLGEHEARIHQIPIEKIHFHELGAVDSIIDIVGFFICLDYLKPEKIFVSPLPVSRGLIDASHGKLPVPAPAALSLLPGIPLVYHDIEGELVTPTGAVLISHIHQGSLPLQQQFKIEQVGYGCGENNFSLLPNLLRIWSGEIQAEISRDLVFQIETNIDDMNPEIYPHVLERLLSSGAMDVTFHSVNMKKGRSGTLISILADKSRLSEIRDILYEETSTIGIRYFEVHREKLPRELKTIDSPWGKMQIKEVRWKGRLKRIPEFDECRRIAKKTGEPLLRIYTAIQTFLSDKEAMPND
jgi:uncharacterized protein (TIGR00299 family) protein